MLGFGPQKESKLIFLHIPKTGGSTLRSIISKFYRKTFLDMPHKPFQPYNHPPQKLIELFQEKLAGFQPEPQVIGGHMFFGLHHYLPEGWRYITVLRHPVERVLSTFYYAVQLKQLALTDIHDFVNGSLPNGRYIWTVSNMQTRYISAENGFPMEVPPDESPLEMLAQAQKHLMDHFLVAGVTDQFDETVVLLKNACHWPRPGYYHVNRTQKKPKTQDVPQEIIDTILRRNALDLALYEFARDRLNARIPVGSPEFDQELVKLRRKNVAVDLRHRVRILLPF
jgi:hypothetical protein